MSAPDQISSFSAQRRKSAIRPFEKLAAYRVMVGLSALLPSELVCCFLVSKKIGNDRSEPTLATGRISPSRLSRLNRCLIQSLERALKRRLISLNVPEPSSIAVKTSINPTTRRKVTASPINRMPSVIAVIGLSVM
jgi:hypothetical protein